MDPAADKGQRMSETKVQIEADRQKQLRAAEELLFAGPQKLIRISIFFQNRFWRQMRGSIQFPHLPVIN